MLVDRAIGQVDKLILNVSEVELVRREANQAFLVDEDGEWLDACYEYIYAQVPFVATDQEWIRDIPLNDALLLEIVKLAHVID